MKETIVNLYRFQLNYLKRLIDNIPEERLYLSNASGVNSPGWILGHIAVEAEDVLLYLDEPFLKLPEKWFVWFRNGSKGVADVAGEELPSKSELMEAIDRRYSVLEGEYLNLSDHSRVGAHPSEFMKNILPDLDSWFAHHLVTHIAVHTGNISVWKKVMGIEVGGY